MASPCRAMRKYLPALLFLSLTLPAPAQPALRYQPKNGFLDATPYVAYLADTSGKLTFEQVRQLPGAAFKPNTKPGLSLGNVSSPHWFRINFAEVAQAEDLYFYSDFQLQYLDVWLIDRAGRIRNWHTGLMRPFGGRDLLTNKYIVNLGRQPGQLFFRVQSPTIHLPVVVSHVGPLMAFTHRFDLFTGGLVGLILALACYNLLLFFSLRDRTFLYYAGYGLMMAYLVLRGIGSWQMFISPQAGWLNADNNTGYILSVLFVYLFVTKFLSLRSLAPTLSRIYTVILVLLLSLMVAEWTLPYHAWQNDLIDLLVIGSAVLVMASGVYTWVLGYEPARYFTLAWFPLMASVVIRFLSLLNVLPKSVFWVDYAAQMGIAVESVLLSAAVAYRFNLFRKEARHAQALALQRAEESEKLLAAHNQMLEENRLIAQLHRQHPPAALPVPEPVAPPQPAIDDLLAKLRNERGRGRKLPVSTAEGILLLPIADIVRIEALGSYCTIFLANHKKIMASKPLAEFEPLLDKDEFLRVHKSHLINIHFVERYVRGEGGTVVMPDGAEVSVSRLMKPELLDRLNIA
jgi:two-component system, sensor histidine kinase LadS